MSTLVQDLEGLALQAGRKLSVMLFFTSVIQKKIKSAPRSCDFYIRITADGLLLIRKSGLPWLLLTDLRHSIVHYYASVMTTPTHPALYLKYNMCGWSSRRILFLYAALKKRSYCSYCVYGLKTTTSL